MTAPPPAFEHRARFPLPASPERVFRALVDPAELSRWFATHVHVDTPPRAGGPYAFHGSAVLGTPGAGEATQKLRAIDPPRSLSFDWSLLGAETTVSYTLTSSPDSADACSLEIVHDVRGRLPFRDPVNVIDDMWRLIAGNLKAHLEGEDSVVLPDYGSSRPEVRLSIEIGAPPAKVFRALLDPAFIDRWLGMGGSRAAVDRGAGTYRYGWEYEIAGRKVIGGPLRILEMVENERLVTDWTDWRGDPDKPMTRVSWILDPVAGGTRTRLTLVHDGFELPVDRGDYQQGWYGFAIMLRDLLESDSAARPV